MFAQGSADGRKWYVLRPGPKGGKGSAPPGADGSGTFAQDYGPVQVKFFADLARKSVRVGIAGGPELVAAGHELDERRLLDPAVGPGHVDVRCRNVTLHQVGEPLVAFGQD